jgi:MFS family permease
MLGLHSRGLLSELGCAENYDLRFAVLVTPEALRVRRTYIVLTLFSTLASSFIWGINTLFLLDAGLNNAQAFAVNAFFTAGTFLFELPTGVIADTRGRRTSYLLGASTLLVSTLLYLLMWQTHAPIWGWAIASILLGLGFTFFSGATEAWLVDALNATGFTGQLESVFARAQVVGGGAMLIGTVAGGYLAQATNLAIPYIVRAALLGLTFAVAWFLMRDIGFTPTRSTDLRAEVSNIVKGAIDAGWHNPAVRWLMLSSPFISGVGFYAFYAMQPYLLDLYGDPTAFGIAGLAAAVLAGAQIVGGLAVPWVRRRFRRRTQLLLVATLLSVVFIALVGLVPSFFVALGFFVLWALLFALSGPVRQAFVNGCIPSEQRATVLSFDSLLGSAGGVVAQPVLGRVADVNGYPASYLVSAGIYALAIPFMWLAKREDAPGDYVGTETSHPSGQSGLR